MLFLPIQPLDENGDLAAAGEANLLQVLLFADAKLEHLRLAGLDNLLRGSNHGWLDTAAADRAADFALLADGQLRAFAAWSRTYHCCHRCDGNALTTRAPLLDIRQNVFHCDTSWLTYEPRAKALLTGMGMPPIERERSPLPHHIKLDQITGHACNSHHTTLASPLPSAKYSH